MAIGILVNTLRRLLDDSDVRKPMQTQRVKQPAQLPASRPKSRPATFDDAKNFVRNADFGRKISNLGGYTNTPQRKARSTADQIMQPLAGSIGSGIAKAPADSVSLLGGLAQTIAGNDILRRAINVAPLIPFDIPDAPQIIDPAGRRLENIGIDISQRVGEAYSPLTAPRPGENQHVVNLASGAGSLATALGLTAATGSPGAASVLFGGSAAGDTYRDARQQGIAPERAFGTAAGVGVGTGLLERAGIDRLVKPGGRFATNLLQKGVSEGLQEGSQELVGNVGRRSFDPNQSLFENVPQAAAYGGILGSGASLALDTGRNPAVQRAGQELLADQRGGVGVDALAPLEDFSQKTYGKSASKLSQKQMNEALSKTGETVLADRSVANKMGRWQNGYTVDEVRAPLVYGGEPNGVYTDSYVMLQEKGAVKSIHEKIKSKLKNKYVRQERRRAGDDFDLQKTEAEFEKQYKQQQQEYKDQYPKLDAIKDIVGEIGETAEVVGYDSGQSKAGYGVTGDTVAYLKSNDTVILVDASRLAFMEKMLPNHEIHVKDSSGMSPVQFVKNGKINGVLMPLDNRRVVIPESIKNANPSVAQAAKPESKKAKKPAPQATKPVDRITDNPDIPADQKQFLLENRDRLKNQYRQLHPDNIVDADEVRELLSELGYDRTNAAEYHEAASALGKELTDENIASLKPGDDFLIMAGSSGAGKGYALKNTGVDTSGFKAGIDGTFASASSLKTLDRIIEKGATPTVIFVNRELDQAWFNGVIKRAVDPDNGRVVPIKVFLESAQSSPKRVLDVIKKYGDKVNVRVIENYQDSTRVVDSPLDYLTNIVDNRKHGEEYKQQLQEETEKYFAENQIARPDILEKLIGRKSRPDSAADGSRASQGQTADVAPVDVDRFIAEQSKLQAVKPSKKGLTARAKRTFIDTLAPAEDNFRQAVKEGKLSEATLEKIIVQNGKSLRAGTAANMSLVESGLVDLLHGMSKSDYDTFNQVLIAIHSNDLRANNIETGRDAATDQQLIDRYGEKFAPEIEKFRQATEYVLDKSVKSGLISNDVAQLLREKYPNYAPMNRVIAELEGGNAFNRRQVANLGQQTIVKKIKGSKKTVVNPIESMIEKVQSLAAQSLRNEAALTWVDALQQTGDATLIEGSVKPGTHTMSVFRDGAKEMYEVDPEMEAAAKGLTREQLGAITNVARKVSRVFKTGTTGLNLPFILTNLTRDQQTALMNQQAGELQTFKAIPKALMETLGHGDLYQEAVRQGAISTSFDLTKPNNRQTAEHIRKKGSKLGVLSKIEDVIGRSEEYTRVQQYIATREYWMKKGLSEEKAKNKATIAAQQNSADFARAGDLGQILNAWLPYTNAGVQGTRSYIRSAASNPTRYAMKAGSMLVMPMIMTALWNFADEEREKIYSDISEFEKQSNFVVVTPWAKKTEDGKWQGIVKIPKPPGISALVNPIEKSIGSMKGVDEVAFGDIVKGVLGFASPLGDSTNSAISTITPQAIKPLVETSINRNLFTGRDIVPYYFKDRAPHEQAFKNTSGTARLASRGANTSPLNIEHIARGYFGELGLQGINALDNTLAKAGIISEEQIGGRSVARGFSRRFTEAYDQPKSKIGASTPSDTILSTKQSNSRESLAERIGGEYEDYLEAFNLERRPQANKISKYGDSIYKNETLSTARQLVKGTKAEGMPLWAVDQWLEENDYSRADIEYDLAAKDLKVAEKAEFLAPQLAGKPEDEQRKILEPYLKESLSGGYVASFAALRELSKAGVIDESLYWSIRRGSSRPSTSKSSRSGSRRSSGSSRKRKGKYDYKLFAAGSPNAASVNKTLQSILQEALS